MLHCLTYLDTQVYSILESLDLRSAAIKGTSLNVSLYFSGKFSQSCVLQSFQNGGPSFWFIPCSLPPGHQNVKGLALKRLFLVCLLHLCVLKPQVKCKSLPISSQLASNMMKQLLVRGVCCKGSRDEYNDSYR